MVDIDERVVQMKFDSSDFEQKSKNTLSILDKLKEKLSFKGAVDASAENFESITQNVQKMADKSYTILDRMKDKIIDNIAGKLVNFVQENTVGQLSKGWSKYADMTTSVATLKSQGYAMEKITDQLERLNYFTDETSYKFTDMVREIGKFTASGQSLEDATTAMMGIAEWASLSGKNANDASRAMYQLSQALGAGQMRLQDYKSVQNLNMDTMEFRKNAIEAAIAVGTLKDNLDGTYTSLLNNKITFSLQSFTESLTQGKWFNTQVMMNVYKKYSEAVDEIRSIYEEGSYMDAQGNYVELNTTADAVKQVKQNNQYLIKQFEKTELNSESITKLLGKWKKVEKVTDMTVDEYAEINELTKEQAELQYKEKQEGYAEYLKEYAETFKDAEKTAEEALEDWHTYVSEYGIKAFESAQEARTFTDAIESAKDAASTVWTTIYTNVFGDYEQAKEIWTDLANALYEIFVTRLWDLNDVFEYWKTGGRSAMEAELESYEKQLDRLKSKSNFGTQDAERAAYLQRKIAELDFELNAVYVNGQKVRKDLVQQEIADYQNELKTLTDKASEVAVDEERIEYLRKEIEKLSEVVEQDIFVNGRTQLFQGIYAFGGGLKSIIMNFRKGWDDVTENNSGGKALLSFSEKFRATMFQFYIMMKRLGETNFYKDIAQGIKNIMAPFKALITIIKSVINQFMPSGESTVSILAAIARAFERLTSKLVPSQETIVKVAKVLRGLGAVIKFIAKLAYALYITVVKPVLSAIWEVLGIIVDIALEIGATLGDAFYEFEEGVGPMEALASVGETLRDVLVGIVKVLGAIVVQITKFVAPVFNFLKNTIKELVEKIKGLFTGGNGNVLENIANGFKDIGDRAKKAWTEGETLADVFNRFKGGSGLGNFIQMIGAMLDNLITRIGRTILAITGLDEEVAKSKIGEGIKTAKDIIVQAFSILKWLYTNVIKPVFQIFFDGIKNSLAEVGEAFRSGDINYMLQTIKNLFNTISSLEIFRLIKVLLRILSSGGLLRVLKNGAGALKGIEKYFKAKATNELANALIKMALAITIVTAAMTALTFLPQDKLETLGGLLMHAGIAMMAMFVALTVLAATMKLMHNPLNSITGMFLSMTLAMITTIATIKIMNKAFGDLWKNTGTDANGNKQIEFDWGGLFTRIGAALAPIISVFGTLLIIAGIANRFRAGTALKNFAIGVAGIGIAVAALALGLKFMVDFVTNVNPSEAQMAIQSIMALLATMTLSGIAMSRFGNALGGWKSGLGTAIAIAGMAMTVALIVIPCLDEMVKNRDKFPQYMEALSVFALTMLSVSASMFLMTVGTKGGLHMLLAGLVFNNVTRMISKFIIPMIQEIQQINFDAAFSGIIAIGGLLLAIGGAVRLALSGVAKIIDSISKINWKSWLAIIVSTGAVIVAMMYLMSTFEKSGMKLSITTILAPLGIVAAICIAFGLFVKSINKTLGSGDKTRENVIKVFKMVIGILLIISAGIVGMLAITGTLFKDNQENAMVLIGEFALSVMLIIITLAASFSNLVKSLVKNTKDLDKTKFDRVKSLLSTMTKFLVLLMGGILLTTLGVGAIYSNPLTSLAPLLGLMVSMSFMMFMFKEAMVDMLDRVTEVAKAMKPEQFKKSVEIIKIMLVSIIILTTVIGSSIVLIGASYGGGYAWQSIISSLAILVAVAGSLFAVTKAFKSISEIVKQKEFTDAVYKKFKFIVIAMAAYIALIVTVLVVALNQMSDRVVNNLANGIIIVGSAVLLTLGLSKLFSNLLSNIDAENFSRNSLIALGMVLAGMVVVTAEMGGFFKQMKEYEVLDWETGLSFAIGLGGFLAALGFAISLILQSVNVLPTNMHAANVIAISMLGMIGIVATSSLLVRQMDNLIGVNWSTALAAMAGISLLVVTLSGIIETISKASVLPTNYTSMFANILVIMATLGAIALFAPSIFNAFKILEGISWGTVIQGLVVILGPMLAIMGIISLMSAPGVADAFLMTSIKIAIGLGIIAAAMYALVKVGGMIKDLFGLGEDAGTAFDKGFKKSEGIKSPSKEMKKNGKYLVQGLAVGLKQNQRIAGNASSNLAEFTNDEFCDTLGIASPSKVFYENGRFVVRGFINGVNDERSKNKQIGTDIASGLGEGLDNALGDFKDNWKGLWTELGMDSDIENAVKNGVGDLPGILEDSIFGSGNKLTEAEEAELKELEALASVHGANFAERYKDKYERMLELQSKKSKSTGNKIGTSISDGIIGGVTDLINGDAIKTKLGELGDTVTGWIGSSDVGSAIAGIFTGDDGVFDQIESSLSGENGEVSKTLNGLVGNKGILTSAESFGEWIGNAISTAASNVFSFDYGSGSLFDRAMSALTGEGNKQRNEQNFKDWYNRYAEQYKLTYDTEKGFTFYHKVMSAIREFGDEGVLDLSRFKEYAEGFNELGSDWKYVDNLSLSDGFFALGEGAGEWNTDNFFDKFDEEIKDAIAYSLGGYYGRGVYSDEVTEILEKYYDVIKARAYEKGLIDKNGINTGSTDYVLFNEYLKNKGYVQDYNSQMKTISDQTNGLLKDNSFKNEDFNEEQLNALKNWAEKNGYLDDKTGAIKDSVLASATNVSEIVGYLQTIVAGGLKVADNRSTYEKAKSYVEGYKNATDTTSKVYYERLKGSISDEVLKDYNASVSNINILNSKLQNNPTSFTATDASNLKLYEEKKKFYEEYYGLGKAKADGEIDGEVKEHNSRKEEPIALTTDDVQNKKDALRINSPSKVYYEIGQSKAEGEIDGEVDGFTAGFKILRKYMVDEIHNVNEDAAKALNAMATSIDDDTIQPTIAPIYDDSAYQIGVDGVNKSIDVMSPKVAASINSFKDNSYNYTNEFVALANRIDATNTLIGNFMSMVESGEIVTVDVKAEADPTNVYNLVVTKNKEAFKRTGRNQLAF